MRGSQPLLAWARLKPPASESNRQLVLQAQSYRSRICFAPPQKPQNAFCTRRARPVREPLPTHAPASHASSTGLQPAAQAFLLHPRAYLHREAAGSSLSREHDTVGAIQHSIGHIGRLCPGGPGILDHALQHLRGCDDRLARLHLRCTRFALASVSMGMTSCTGHVIDLQSHVAHKLHREHLQSAGGYPQRSSTPAAQKLWGYRQAACLAAVPSQSRVLHQ